MAVNPPLNPILMLLPALPFADAESLRCADAESLADGLSCAERDGTIWPLDQASIPLNGEHPNGTLALAPVLSVKLGELEGDI